MPRHPRFLPPDNYYHIVNRGNNRLIVKSVLINEASPKLGASANKWAGGANNLANHLENHGGEMSAAQYTQKAVEITTRAQQSGLQENGRTLFMKDDWFTVVNSAGKIVTSFPFDKVKSGCETASQYFDKMTNLIK